MPLGPMKTKAQKQAGMHEVMGEFKRGQLRSGSKTGPRVTNRKQAIAIGLNQTGQSRGYAEGGIVNHDFDQDLPRAPDDARLIPLTGGPSQSDISRTVDLLQRNQRQLDEGGDGYEPSNFFLRRNREVPYPRASLPYPRSRPRRRTQDGDFEELFDPSNLRHQGRGGVRYLDDGGGDGGGGGEGSGGCGGCGEGGGCGCTGDSCGSGACGGCSCGGSCGVGGIGGFGGSQGAGCGGGFGGCSAASGGCGGCSGEGGCGGGCSGTGDTGGGFGGGCVGGGCLGAAAAGGAEGQTGQTGGQQGGPGYGLGGPSGMGLGATGAPGAPGDVGNFGNPSAAAYGISGISGAPAGLGAPGTALGAALGPAGITAAAQGNLGSLSAHDAFAGGPFSGAALGTAYGAETGGQFGPGAGVTGTGTPGTGAFGTESNAGGGGWNGLGLAAASWGGPASGGGPGGGANVGNTIATTGGRGGDEDTQGQSGRGGSHATTTSPGAAPSASPASPGAAVGEAAGIGLAGTASPSGGGESPASAATGTGGEAAAIGGAAAAADDVGPAAGEAAPIGGAPDPSDQQGGRGGGRAAGEAAPIGGAPAPAAPSVAPAATTPGPGGFTGQVGNVSVSPATAANTQDLSGGVYGAAPAATTAAPGGLSEPGNIGGIDFGPGNPFGDPGFGLPATQDISQPTQTGRGNTNTTIGYQGSIAPGGFESISQMAVTNPATFGAPATSFSTNPGGMYGLNASGFTGGSQGAGGPASAATGTGGEAAAIGGAAPAGGAPTGGIGAAAGEAAAIGGEPDPGGSRGGGRAGEAAPIGGAPAPSAGEAAPMGGAPAPGATPGIGGGLGAAPAPAGPGGWTSSGLGQEAAPMGGAPAPGGAPTGGLGPAAGEAAPMGGAAAPAATVAGEAAAIGGAPAPGEGRGGGRGGEAAPLGGAPAIAPGVGPGGWTSSGRGGEAAPSVAPAAPSVAPAAPSVAPAATTPGPGGFTGQVGNVSISPATAANTQDLSGGVYGAAPAATTAAPGGLSEPGNIGALDFGPGNPFGDPGFGLPATQDIGQRGEKDQSRAQSGKDQSQAPSVPASGTFGAPAPASGDPVDRGNIGAIDFGPDNPFGDPNYGLPATQDIGQPTLAPGTRGGLSSPSFASNIGNVIGGLVGGLVGTAQAASPNMGAAGWAAGPADTPTTDPGGLFGATPSLGPAPDPGPDARGALGNLSALSMAAQAAPAMTTTGPTAAGGPTGGLGNMGAAGWATGMTDTPTTDPGGLFGATPSQGPTQDPGPDARGVVGGLSGLSMAAQAAADPANMGAAGWAAGPADTPSTDPGGLFGATPAAAPSYEQDLAPDLAAPPADFDPNMEAPVVGPALQGPAPAPSNEIDPGTLDRTGSRDENARSATLAAYAPSIDPYVGTQHSDEPVIDPSVPVSPPPSLAPPAVAPPPAAPPPASPFDINPAPSFHAPSPNQATLGATLAAYAPATPDPGFEAPQSERGAISHSPLGEIGTVSPTAQDALSYATDPQSMASPGPALSGGALGYDVPADLAAPPAEVTVDRSAKGDRSATLGPGVGEGQPSGLGAVNSDRGLAGGPTAGLGGPDFAGLSAYSYGEDPFGEIAGPYGYYTDNRGGQNIARGGVVRRADGGPLGDSIKRFVDVSPSMAAGQVDQNPAIGDGLARMYANNPEPLGWMFSEVGHNRRDQNPAISSDDQSKQPQQIQITGGQQPGQAFAHGGYVDEPGYYATGGLGPAQMRSMGSQAHYSGANVRPALNPPGVHLMAASTPGRTDRIPMRTKAGSYVLPADVVSGLGQGNTQAGAKMWGQALMAAAGPAGAGVMGGGLRRGLAPRAPAMPRMGGMGSATRGFADGGMPGMGHNMGPPMEDDEYVPIVTAGGEVLIDPEIVMAIGNGSELMGKKKLADSVLKVRKQTLDHIKSLPRPVR